MSQSCCRVLDFLYPIYIRPIFEELRKDDVYSSYVQVDYQNWGLMRNKFNDTLLTLRFCGEKTESGISQCGVFTSL